MELRQIHGPFQANETVRIAPQTGYSYVHIGIQVPKSQPIGIPATQVSDDGKKTTLTGEYRESYPYIKVEINGDLYQISDTGILEFDSLSEAECNVRFLSYMPPETIIDVVRRN